MEDNRKNSSNNSQNNGGKPDGKRPKINFFAMMLISVALVLLISVIFNAIEDSQYTETTYSDFLKEMEEHLGVEVMSIPASRYTGGCFQA